MSNSFKLSAPVVGLDVASPHDDGHWISDRVARIVELIRDIDPNIDVQWVPPENRQFGDPAFRLMEVSAERPPYVMFYVQTEAEFDERVLQRIIQSDASKNALKLSDIDAKNQAIKLSQAKTQADEREAMNDFAHHVFKSPKARYRHNGRVYE